MSTLPKITIPSVLLITLAICLQPAYSGSAGVVPPGSTSPAMPAPAQPTPPGALAPAAAPLPASSDQMLLRLNRLGVDALRGAVPVLVIPSQEMMPETYDRIVEDLTIMSRIIEKSVRSALEESYAVPMERGVLLDADYVLALGNAAGPRILRPSNERPRPLYIGGYGAIFSLRVGLPLVPPPEAAEPNKTGEKGDEVWAAAQRELANPQPAHRPLIVTAPQGRPYRQEAVEGLKNALTAALKHAANIRDLESDAWLTILVQGPGTVQPNQPPVPDQNGIVYGPYATGMSLLTLRAKKADIDQFAKGQLDQTQFQQRVQIVTTY